MQADAGSRGLVGTGPLAKEAATRKSETLLDLPVFSISNLSVASAGPRFRQFPIATCVVTTQYSRQSSVAKEPERCVAKFSWQAELPNFRASCARLAKSDFHENVIF